MRRGDTLTAALEAIGADAPSPVRAAARAVLALAGAAAELAEIIATPSLDGSLGAKTGGDNSDGDQQRKLDLVAEDLCREALRGAGVGPYLSEEIEAPTTLDPAGAVAVAIDPLDGSSNIDVNGVIGTIFSILPAPPGAGEDPALAFTRSGRAQLGAGFFVYGPQTSLVVSLGAGVDVFILDRARGAFRLVETGVRIPRDGSDFAINASNSRHWREPVRRYIDDCLSGREGARGRDFNMRWAASLVADAFRVFTRGGVFLYPSDARKGYDQGRLRLLYEASPIAFLAEQAGGAAIDGAGDILDIVPSRPHARAPLIMGSAEEVETVRRHHLEGLAPESRPARARAGG
jgi:fructose-1,6-bisphosphatase I